MSENEPVTAGAVATAEPPHKPPAPPATATAAPRPPRRKPSWIGWTVGLLVALLIVGGLGWLVWAQLSAKNSTAPGAAGTRNAFESAMKKAGVSAATAPGAPVDLATISASGSHPFDATFTGEELSALMNAFPHVVTIGNAPVSLSNVTIQIGKSGGLTLSGHVSAGGNSYSGRVSGDVGYHNGHVVAPTPLTVTAEGFALGGNQAQQATQLLLAYANGYLAAAPGLAISTATLTPNGVHAAGTAPDRISW